MKKLPLQFCLLLFISVFTFSGCLKDDADDPWNNMPAAGVMYFVNSYPNAEEGLLYRVDDNVVMANPLAGEPLVLAYQQFSPAQLLHPGNRKLVITSYNNDQNILVDTTLTIKIDTGYTSFVYGTDDKPTFAMTEDEVIEGLTEDQSGIRFLNLANGAGNVNLYIEGTEEPLYKNRPTETGTSVVKHQAFQAQKSGVYTLKVTDANGKELATREYKGQHNKGLLNGYYYTIMLTGKANDKKTPLYIGVVEHR